MGLTYEQRQHIRQVLSERSKKSAGKWAAFERAERATLRIVRETEEARRRRREKEQARRAERMVEARRLLEGVRLTANELVALHGEAAGERTPATAERTGISVHTLHDARKSARRKLGARNMTHAVAIAVRGGLLE